MEEEKGEKYKRKREGNKRELREEEERDGRRERGRVRKEEGKEIKVENKLSLVKPSIFFLYIVGCENNHRKKN